MSIYQEGNDVREKGTGILIGCLVSGTNNIVNFKPATGVRLTYQLLSDIAKFIEPMTHSRIVRDQAEAPKATGTEEANRPRVVSLMGPNVFRTVGGSIGDSDPIGSIEDGPVFVPAPGVTFSHQELSQITGFLQQRAGAA